MVVLWFILDAPTWLLFLTQTFKTAAQQLCVLVNLFPAEICLSFSTLSWYVPSLDMAAIILTPRDAFCGTSPNCFRCICDIFSGLLLVSVHNITAIPTGNHVINTVCYTSLNSVTGKVQMLSDKLMLRVYYVWDILPCNQQPSSQMTKNSPHKFILKISAIVALFLRNINDQASDTIFFPNNKLPFKIFLKTSPSVVSKGLYNQ